MLGYALLFAGGVFLWAAFTHRADAVLSALKTDLTKFDPTLPNTPIGNSSSGNNALVDHFDVTLPGGGSVRTNASDPQAALDNVKVQTGMTGTGVTRA